MGMHKVMVSLDDEHFEKLKDIQRDTGKVYDDLIAMLIDRT